MKRRALLQGLTVTALAATPAMRAAALVRDFGVAPFNVYRVYGTAAQVVERTTFTFEVRLAPQGAVARLLLEETT